MPAPAANKHNKLPSKQVHGNTSHYASVHIGKLKKKRSVSTFCGREAVGCLSTLAVSVCSAAVERRGNVIPVAFSIQTKHPQTYTHTTWVCLQTYLLTSEWCVCIFVCSVPLFASCTAVHMRLMGGGEVAQQVSECFFSPLCLIFFSLFLFRGQLNTLTQTYGQFECEV